MRIDKLAGVDQYAKIEKTRSRAKVEKQAKSDSISVSSQAVKNAELYAVAEAVKATPDIRMDRINEVKERMADPNYIEKALDDVAGRIVDMFGI